MKNHRFLTWLTFFLLSIVSGYAQHYTGKVFDSNQEPLIGVAIQLKGTSKGTITDSDGSFSIGASKGETLVFSYISYKTQEIFLTDNLNLIVILQENSEMLDEVVVVGYGTMRKKDLTGSVSQIRPDALANEAPKTIQDVLRGTAGLNVGFDNSAKGGGSMSIRGQRSVYTDGGHNDPLIILDGMMFYGELSEINPNDIAQIDVLKDASSAAVYGAKAANGVVIVTTKKGKSEKPIINFSANMGWATRADGRKVYDADGYLKYRTDFYTTDTYGINRSTGKYEAYQTGNRPSGYYDRPTDSNLSKYGLTMNDWRNQTTQDSGMSNDEVWARRIGLNASEVTLANFLAGKTFNWYDHSFQTGLNQDYNVSVSGMSNKTNYYFSLGYLSNEGMVRGNEYSAIRSNLKLDTKVTNWFSVGANVNFQNRTDGDIATDWYNQITSNSPFATPYNDKGELVAHPQGENAYWKGYNFDFDRQYLELEKGFTVFNSILTAKLTLPYGITYSFNASPRYQFFYDRYYRSSEHPDWKAETDTRVNREQTRRFDWSINNTINWDYTFSQKHHVMLTLVQEAEERQSWLDRIEAKNILPSEALGLHATANADKSLSAFRSTDTKETATGYLARIFYSYDDKYMGTFSFRRDGYSAFGTTNPYANFLSGALAWTFTNENFWKWSNVLSSGKLRISFGQNGNRSLSDPYIALANLALGMYSQGYINSTNNTLMDMKYLFVDRLPNTGLQWEKTTSWNLGLDLSFLKSRINATMEYYIMPTTDMIMNQTLPDFTGFTSITTNLGRVENRGVEISLNTRNIEMENFEWNTTLSFSYNKNEIKKLYGEYETTVDATGNITTKERNDISNEWFIGQPIGAIWDYEVTGIWQKDEVEEAAKYGQKPGDPKVANHYTADDRANPDGTTSPVYNNNDKQFLGETTPSIHWSIRNNLLYKNWAFSFNIYSYMGHKSLDNNYLNNDNNYSQITNCQNLYIKDYWTVDNPSNEYARLSAQGPTGLTAPRRVIDRSFIRLENISVAYNLPDNFLSKFRIQNAKVFATVRNVATWSKEWKYGDPETGDIAPRTYSLGINLTF